jgi:hypothetical protein
VVKSRPWFGVAEVPFALDIRWQPLKFRAETRVGQLSSRATAAVGRVLQRGGRSIGETGAEFRGNMSLRVGSLRTVDRPDRTGR